MAVERSGEFWKHAANGLVEALEAHGCALVSVLGNQHLILDGAVIGGQTTETRSFSTIPTPKQVRRFCWEIRKSDAVRSPAGVLWGIADDNSVIVGVGVYGERNGEYRVLLKGK